MAAQSRLILFAAVAGLAASAAAQEDGAPDLSFLEYLGSWQESDEEWLLIAAMEGELETDDEAAETEVDGEDADETDED
jgi:hypothetical protein